MAKIFVVIEVDLEHNHRLQLPQTRHLLASQRKISEVQAFEIETADDSGIMPKAFEIKRGSVKELKEKENLA